MLNACSQFGRLVVSQQVQFTQKIVDCLITTVETVGFFERFDSGPVILELDLLPAKLQQSQGTDRITAALLEFAQFVFIARNDRKQIADDAHCAADEQQAQDGTS